MRCKLPYSSLSSSSRFSIFSLQYFGLGTFAIWPPIKHNAELQDEDFSDYEQVYLKTSRAFSNLGKEYWGIHCICSIHYNTPTRTEVIAAGLRNAWMRLVVEYPGLSMVPVGLRKHYSRLDETSILSWAQNTFFVRGDLSASDVVAGAKPRDLPSLYYLPASSELVLLIQHWRADGLGACMLLNRLFERLEASNNPSNLGDQSEQNPPSPSLESAAGASTTADPEIQAYARDYIESFHNNAVNSGGLPFQGNTTTPPLRPMRCDLDFPADRTNTIIAACKSRQISVTAAIHAALARTVFSYLTEAECQAGYTTVMAVNMRPHLPSPYNSKVHACQTYVASITPTVPYSSGFVDAARTLTYQYQNWWSEEFMRSLRWIYRYHLAKLSAPRPENAAPAKPPSGAILSSLGVVERHLRGVYGPDLKIGNFRLGASMMTRQVLLYAWTFGGQLILSLSYNEAYYTDSMAREVVTRVASYLGGGLDLDLTTDRLSS